MNKLKRMFKGNSGQGMVEYGLILALVSIISIGSLALLGGGISGKFDDVLNALGDGNPGGSPVGISTDADYIYDWGPLEELGDIPTEGVYYATDADFDLLRAEDFGMDDGDFYRYNKADDPTASDYKPVVVIPKTIDNEVVTSYDFMFFNTYVTAVYAEDSSAVTSMAGMFMSVQSNSILIDHMDTRNVTNMMGMFAGVGSPENPITSFTFGNLDTSNVTNMDAMFMGSHISKLDLRRMDTSSVRSMVAMFSMMGAMDPYTPMQLNVTSFDTRNVKLAAMMFENSPVVELDVRNFRSDSIEENDPNNVSSMFYGINVPMLDLSQFKLTPNITAPNLDGEAMFAYSTIGTLDLSGMELAGTDVNDWDHWGNMLYGATVEKAYVKTDADAAIINMFHSKSPDYNFVGLPN